MAIQGRITDAQQDEDDLDDSERDLLTDEFTTALELDSYGPKSQHSVTCWRKHVGFATMRRTSCGERNLRLPSVAAATPPRRCISNYLETWTEATYDSCVR
jgi:hypothetical protein